MKFGGPFSHKPNGPMEDTGNQEYWDGLYGSGHWVPPDLPGDTYR